jgi:hypothetical protein
MSSTPEGRLADANLDVKANLLATPALIVKATESCDWSKQIKDILTLIAFIDHEIRQAYDGCVRGFLLRSFGHELCPSAHPRLSAYCFHSRCAAARRNLA